MLRFCRSKVSIIAFIGIVIVLLFAVFAPALSRWDYNDQDLNRINLPPKVPVLENYGILDGTRWLTNRRVDSLEDTSRYPEGSILKVINHRTVQGVEMCDIKVDYYKYSGVEDGTYFWMGTELSGPGSLGAHVARRQGLPADRLYFCDLQRVHRYCIRLHRRLLRRKGGYDHDAYHRDHRRVPRKSWW